MECYFTVLVPTGFDDTKVGRFLRRQGLSGGVIKRAAVYPDGITVDDAPAHPGVPLKAGQTLSVLLSDRVDGDLIPTEGDCHIVYEDDDILVIDKPAGLAVHPGPGHESDTLGNFLTYYYKKRRISFVFRPVNRLDRQTSGLMVVARHAHAHEVLKGQLHGGTFRRVYLAVCHGVPPAARSTVTAPIRKEDGPSIRRIVAPDGAWARTRYAAKRVGNGMTLLRLTLDTGRTHQIRVHMAHLGCPLVGDFLYGTEDRTLISRTALHAAELTLRHPMTGESMAWRTPLPEDMEALL